MGLGIKSGLRMVLGHGSGLGLWLGLYLGSGVGLGLGLEPGPGLNTRCCVESVGTSPSREVCVYGQGLRCRIIGKRTPRTGTRPVHLRKHQEESSTLVSIRYHSPTRETQSPNM